MEEHEKALISRQFIEVMLKVPVILCPGRIEAIETGIKEYFPDFIKVLLSGKSGADGDPLSESD